MPTDIAPSLGHGVLFTQGGVGSTPGYDAIDDRTALTLGGCQEGVYESGAYKVAQRAAGADMSVDVAASTGHALVQGDAVSFQDLYGVRPHSAVINEAIVAADATNPRLDQVILEVLDNQHDGSGNSKARVRVVAGTPTSGATLANRSGAAALPSSAIRLADVLVAAADTSITNAEIRDRRPWARGAFHRIVRNANGAGGANYSTTSTSFVVMDATNLNPRIECSGVPLRVALNFMFTSSSAASYGHIQPRMDGAVLDGGAFNGLVFVDSVVAQVDGATMEWVVVPAAGSHQFAPYFASESAKTFTVYADAAAPFQMTVEELVGQNASND